MTNDEQLSLRMYHLLTASEPRLKSMLERISVSNYKDFVDLLYQDLDEIVREIQKNSELRINDNEDRLTIDIVALLNMQGYESSHETKVGGHVDLLVKKNSFMWICEAKIHRTYNYLWQGFLQLTTRYSIGDECQSDGGLIIYIRQKNTQQIMSKWRETLSTKNLEDFSSENCPKNPLAFFSSHIHEKSGLSFRVRHIPVMLYFKPQDKSGKKHQKKNQP